MAFAPLVLAIVIGAIVEPGTDIAAVGHAATHGGSSHWLQRVTWKDRRVFGKKPVSTYFTYVRVTESGTSFSDLQAVVHAWHPMQRV